MNGDGRDVEIMTRNQNIQLEASEKESPTAPIPCAPPSKDEIFRLELEKELNEMYEIATWQMYRRIKAARRRNVCISKSCSRIETRHQSIYTHSKWSQENIQSTSGHTDNIAQFDRRGNHDEPFAFIDFEM